MALQVVVTVDDVAKREEGGTLTLRLKLFSEGVMALGSPVVTRVSVAYPLRFDSNGN